MAIVVQRIDRRGGCQHAHVLWPKRFVYILRSKCDPRRYYTGVTSNLRAPLAAHNGGECAHTAERRPRDLDVVIAFHDQARAMALERYLKTGSGVAFSKRRFADRS